jgi:hypothetical protein
VRGLRQEVRTRQLLQRRPWRKDTAANTLPWLSTEIDPASKTSANSVNIDAELNVQHHVPPQSELWGKLGDGMKKAA